MEPTIYDKMSTLDGRMELIMESARKFGYDKELLYLVGGFLFSDKITQPDIMARLKEFRDTQYSKLNATQKDFLLLGFENYMLIAHEYNKEVRPAIKNVVDFIRAGIENSR